jgi:uncharacterized protein
MSTSRRNFLIGSAVALGAATAGTAFQLRSQRHGTLLSGFEDARGDQYVGGVSLETEHVFGTRVPMRVHGCAIDPCDPQRVVFFARRPGTAAFELRRDTLQVRTLFETPQGRHLAGHGVFSQDGSLLYTPEHDYENARGVLTVRKTSDFTIVDEIDTRGIDPHEVAWLPDKRSLLVANGGIMTHPRTFRRKLNIPTMDPSLSVIDAGTGECREQWRLPDHLLSIRHMSVAPSGMTAIGLQYEGEPADAPGIVAIYTPGSGLRLLPSPRQERVRFHGYVASIAVSERQQLIAAACPYGDGVACWSAMDDQFIGFVAAAENYGLSRLADGTIVASQRDGTAYEIDKTPLRSHFLQIASEFPLRWDDHWVAVT